MTSEVLNLLGGIGLFLFGMRTMTEALSRLASSRARRFLARVTTTPFRGVLAGAATTAAIQSSSATVLTVIGFVGAGLLTFPQALGVIFGANIGTTVTGWMIAILGLRLHLGTLAMPIVFAGALAAALLEGRRADAGLAAVGFALLFLGLDLMQGGAAAAVPLVEGLAGTGDGLGTRLVLVLAGFAVTAVVQASSAGVAAVLVLLSGGAIGLVQAAALVVGMDLGTTLKSVLATLGGSRDMRLTAAAHVGYNAVTAIVAFGLVGLLPPVAAALRLADTSALVAFHTAFNAIGVVILLPVIRPFAAALERIVPGRGALDDRLDRALAAEPAAALDTAAARAAAIAGALFAMVAARLRNGGGGRDGDAIHSATEDLEDFLTGLSIPAEDEGPRNRIAALLHMTDHLHRLAHRAGQTDRIALVRRDPVLRRAADALAAALAQASPAPGREPGAGRIRRLHDLIRRRTERLRHAALLREHAGIVEPGGLFELTDAIRWLERTSDHAERIVHYAGAAAREAPSRADAARSG